MDTTRWQQLSPLLDELLELAPSEREAWLDAQRARDPALAAELASLVALEEGNDDFLSEPVVPPQRGVLPGGEVGPYRLEHLLGEGGMGQVWLAARADGLYQRRVALKLLRPGLADTNLRLRFTRERQILARLAHPHIARLLDAGVSTDGLPYLALEYVDGAPITDYCREHRTPLAARLRMFGQVCDAVSHAHANLIVHRDLKPSNILVSPAGEVRLLDFGIAKLLDTEPAPEQTRTGVRAFTLHYAAPEQVRGEPVTTMTDVYSLGVVLYELLADRKPYRPTRDTDAAWEEAILAHDPLRPSQALLRAAEADQHGESATSLRRRARLLAGDLDNIVLKAMSKLPEHRYPSVEALAQDLERHVAGRPVHARPQSVRYRVSKYVLRHRWALGTGTLTALVLAASLGVVAWQAREAVREAARAQAMQNFMVGVFERAAGSGQGEPLDLRELLTDAVDRGERELGAQPRALAEVLGAIARLRIGLGDHAQAGILLQRQARLIATAGDVPASLRLESLTRRGQVLRLTGDPRGCVELMQPALGDAEREQAQLPPQAAEFYSQLGRCRRATGEQRGARRLFERALTLRRHHPVDGAGEVDNLIDLAGLRADAGQVDGALVAFEGAGKRLAEVAGDRHPLWIDIRRELARLHRARGDLAQAERELMSALELSQEINGGDHVETIAIRGQLASVLADRGRLTMAWAALEVNRRLLEARHGTDDPALAGSLGALGRLAWQRGDPTSAIALLRQALSLQRRSGDPVAVGDALVDLGSVLHAAGQDPPAHPLLLEAVELRRRHLGDDHPATAEAGRLLGLVEVALGEPRSGAARLAHALDALRAAYGETHPATRLAELSLARFEATDAATPAKAGTALERLDALGALPDTPVESRRIAWQAQAYAADLRCRGADHSGALARLEELGAQLRLARPEGGAISRDVATILAACRQPGAPGQARVAASRDDS